MRLNGAEFTTLMENRHLSDGDIKLLFATIDANLDTYIDTMEW